ncbi:RNA-directed DNA polymerase, eukaryota, Reverse transcriptase zinc-binding domain protein [Artemisia annua]|uniref:RNA-directed DNA polymerase, eukaryota, Reverse transcriptase zinc-binding domain protein n=1 Tax=Artemisia annua TaxID=35608 RepID=A0A2U1LXC6_ARTAN|nr:RNA-directed DNA polymerase, eukaryota, Reverse transcriptase zinc-binding domain protein [Artemisia annua]
MVSRTAGSPLTQPSHHHCRLFVGRMRAKAEVAEKLRVNAMILIHLKSPFYSLLCPCCENYIETVEHCIMSCEDALSVWEMIFAWWGMGSVNVFTIKDLFNHTGGLGVDKVSRKLWNAVLRVAGYSIWKHRNDRVFKGITVNIVRLFQDIQLKSYEWINRRSDSLRFEWEKWIVRPQRCGFVQDGAGDN